MKSATMHIYAKAGEKKKKMTSSHFHIVISVQSYHIKKSPNQMFLKIINEFSNKRFYYTLFHKCHKDPNAAPWAGQSPQLSHCRSYL